jgi:hypothetical protein
MLKNFKLPFLVNDPKRLDVQFYSGYDERFLYRKVRVLWAALSEPDILQQFVTEDDGPDERERLRHALAAELLFAEFHQFESFFAMLVAAFQSLPHWIFLSTYSTGEIKEKVRQFIAGDFGALSNGMAQDRDGFLRYAVYNNYSDEHTSLNETFENIWWIVYRMAEKYSAADEYNSYKHGLRMMSAMSTLTMSRNPTDFSNAFVMSSPHSITHLKLKKVDNGTSVAIETKAFNPEESCAHVRIMSDILANIKRVRLAALSGKTQAEITLFTGIDKQGLQQLAVLNDWSFPA